MRRAIFAMLLLTGCDTVAGRPFGTVVCEDTHVVGRDSLGAPTGDTLATFRVCGAPLRRTVRP